MSRNVASIREELLVEENLRRIEQENHRKLQEESLEKHNKFVKSALTISVISNVVIFPVIYLLMPNANLFGSAVFSLLVSFAIFPILMFIYTAFFSNPTPVIDVEGWHSKIAYLKKIRKLEFELLTATTGAKIIKIKNDELGKEWHNMILEIDGKAKEYYVSFPRDEKGYTSVEHYEFFPARTK